jgi:hypothetical protein
MKSFLVSLALFVALVGTAAAQPITTDKGKQSDEVYVKIRKIDLLNQILPLLLTKEQINKILPSIESARAKWKMTLSQEDEELSKLRAQVDETYNKAVEKNEYPSKEFTTMIAAKTKSISMKRSIVLIELVEVVQDHLLKILNEGQKKAHRPDQEAGRDFRRHPHPLLCRAGAARSLRPRAADRHR